MNLLIGVDFIGISLLDCFLENKKINNYYLYS